MDCKSENRGACHVRDDHGSVANARDSQAVAELIC